MVGQRSHRTMARRPEALVAARCAAQFLEIASAISDGGFAPKPRRGIRSRRFIDALSVSGNRLRDFRWGLCPQTPQRDSFASIYRRSLSFWKSPPRFPMGALPPNPAEGFVRVDLSTLSQFLEIASAISDGGFAPKPRRGIRSRRFIDALSGQDDAARRDGAAGRLAGRGGDPDADAHACAHHHDAHDGPEPPAGEHILAG
jgi:hypothetical protein